MNILGLDPGPMQTAWVVYVPEEKRVLSHGIQDNETVIQTRFSGLDHVVCEWVSSYGMPVGAEVFDTVEWVGRYHQYAILAGIRFDKIKRATIKMHLCNSMRAKDSNVRQSIIDRFGGRDTAIGKKKTPGPLHSIKSHEWSALAVVVTWAETEGKSNEP